MLKKRHLSTSQLFLVGIGLMTLFLGVVGLPLGMRWYSQAHASLATRIAEYCSVHKKEFPSQFNQSLTGDYVFGQVYLKFKPELSTDIIREHLSREGFRITDDTSFFEPTKVAIVWSDEFLAKLVPITVAEVNSFLSAIRKEPYVQKVEVTNSWYPPLAAREPAPSTVKIIDRWGNFTVTFTDPTKIDDFLQKYPAATFYGYGTFQIRPGLWLSQEHSQIHSSLPEDITILYKADGPMAILRGIENKLGLAKPSSSFVLSPGEKRTEDPFIAFNDDAATTSFALHFPSRYGTEDIHKILHDYPALSSLSTVEKRMNVVSIGVPSGEEVCWETQFKKDPLIELTDLVGSRYPMEN